MQGSVVLKDLGRAAFRIILALTSTVAKAGDVSMLAVLQHNLLLTIRINKGSSAADGVLRGRGRDTSGLPACGVPVVQERPEHPHRQSAWGSTHQECGQ